MYTDIFDRFGHLVYDGAYIELGNVSKGMLSIASLFAHNTTCDITLQSSSLRFFTENDKEELELSQDIHCKLTPDNQIANIVFVANNIGNNVCPVQIQLASGDIIHITVTATVIDVDERLLVILSNFGYDYLEYFNKAMLTDDIRQDVVDYILQNSKAREFIIRRDDIVHKLGTYNGLHAALDWLGYTDAVTIYEVLKSIDNRSRTLVHLQEDITKYTGIYKRTNLLQLTYEYNVASGNYLDCGAPEFVRTMADNQDLLLKLQYLVMILEDVFLPEHIHFADVSIEAFSAYIARYLYGVDSAMIVTSLPYTPAATLTIKDVNAHIDEDVAYIRPHAMLLPATAFATNAEGLSVPNDLQNVFVVNSLDVKLDIIDADYVDWLIKQNMQITPYLLLSDTAVSLLQQGSTEEVELQSNRDWHVTFANATFMRYVQRNERIFEVKQQ